MHLPIRRSKLSLHVTESEGAKKKGEKNSLHRRVLASRSRRYRQELITKLFESSDPGAVCELRGQVTTHAPTGAEP